MKFKKYIYPAFLVAVMDILAFKTTNTAKKKLALIITGIIVLSQTILKNKWFKILSYSASGVVIINELLQILKITDKDFIEFKEKEKNNE